MSDDPKEILHDFLNYQWGDTTGQVYLATLEKGENFTQYMLDWPRMAKKIPEFVVQQAAAGRDVYYCPSIFLEKDQAVEKSPTGKTKAVRTNVKGSNSFWVDFDNGQGPEDWAAYAKEQGIPEPTLIIQSSVKGNQHVYWRAAEFQDSIEAVESVNRALALKVGADRSGWDGNQLLRLPYTPNFGYKGDGSHKAWYNGRPATVSIQKYNPGLGYSPSQFDAIKVAEREAVERLDHGGPYPGIEEVLAKQKWTDDLYKQFTMTGDEAAASSPDKRSGAIQKLAYLAAEAGFNDDQIFSVLDDTATRWGKFSDRSTGARRKELFRCIARARTKIGYITEETLTFAGLLTNTDAVEGEPEKYIYRWDEFLEADMRLDWLVEGILPVGGYGLLTGQPGVGKTQVGLQFCITLALGNHEFLGWKVNDGAHKTLMFSLEMGGPPLQHFALNIQKAYPGLEREIGKNFSVIPMGSPVDILSKEGYAFIDNVLSEHKPDLVFIDSLKKIMGKSLNDDEAIRSMNDAIGSLRKKHRCAFLVIHHDRKKQSGGKAVDPGDLSDMYGSQYIGAEADSVLSFRKSGEPDYIVMDIWKIRLSQELPPKALRRQNLQFIWEKDAGIERFANSVTHNIGGGGKEVGTDADPVGGVFGFEGRLG